MAPWVGVQGPLTPSKYVETCPHYDVIIKQATPKPFQFYFNLKLQDLPHLYKV